MTHVVEKLFVLLGESFLFLAALVQPVLAQETDLVKLTNDQQKAYSKFKNASSNFFVSWDDLDSAPDWVRMTNLKMNWRSEDYAERAYQFLEEYGALYKIIDPKWALQIQSQEQDALGMTHVTLQQVYQGVPVFAGQLQFHFRSDGTIASIHGNIIPGADDINSKPTITRQRLELPSIIASQIYSDGGDQNIKFSAARLASISNASRGGSRWR